MGSVSKVEHFSKLSRDAGFSYEEMLFFDDDAWMNLREVSELGVFCCHTPKGVTRDLFLGALEAYATTMSKEGSGERGRENKGVIVTSRSLGLANDNDDDDEGRIVMGYVKFYSAVKRFGFVRGEDGKEYFLHESKIPDGTSVRTGSNVEFMTLKDGKGRAAAAVISTMDNDDAKIKMGGGNDSKSRSSNGYRGRRGGPDVVRSYPGSFLYGDMTRKRSIASSSDMCLSRCAS